ncbi:lipopolysaccharide biosynthesis protein [Bacteroidia bacterium]|nr:lipopolysaccharide biosynthesis protein [Bacteroidia bacterium]
MNNNFLNGLSWSSLDIIGTKVLSLLVQLALSRILVPDDFGLIAMISILIGFSELIIDGGLSQSLIRKKNATKVDYSTVFIFNILIAIIIYLAVYFSAPSIANFYFREELINITRVYTLSILINSFVVVNKSILLKKLRFDSMAKINIFSIVLGSIVGVGLAMANFGVWSIVFMRLTVSIVSTILFLILERWRFIIFFDWSIFKYHFTFGYKVISTYITKAISDDLYSVIIGKFYNTSILGSYNRASVINKFGVIALGRTFSNVTYSFFNSDDYNENKIRILITKINRFILLIYFPVIIFAYFNASPIVFLILGGNWSAVIPFFKILLLGSLFEPITYYFGSLINTFNKPNVVFKINFFVRIFSLFIALLFLNHIDVMLISYSLSIIIISILHMHYGGKLIKYDITSQLFDLQKEIYIVALILLFQTLFVSLTNYTEIKTMYLSFILTIVIMVFLTKIFNINFNFFKQEF